MDNEIDIQKIKRSVKRGKDNRLLVLTRVFQEVKGDFFSCDNNIVIEINYSRY